MEEEEIRELEPKYTGNTRHLSEGEAAGIKAELERQGEDDEPNLVIPPFGLTRNGTNL